MKRNEVKSIGHEAGRTPKISIVVLNWNGMEDTAECLRSVAAIDYPSFEVIVVDNGSSDQSVNFFRKYFGEISIIETGRNLGYAGGNNVGIGAALSKGAEYVLVLNNDTVVDPDLLNAFVEAAREFPDGGMFGAKVYYFSEPNRIWYAGAKWNSRYLMHLGKGQIDTGADFTAIAETDFAQGCALFTTAEAIKTIGSLEEKFFLFYEEADWCYRARKAGFKTFFVPRAKVWHKISASLGSEESVMGFYFHIRNRLLWAERNLSRKELLILYGLSVKEVVKAFVGLLPGVFSRGNASANGLKRTYWSLRDFPRQLGINWGRYRGIVLALFFGLRDYSLRRFGDCPKFIRLLHNEARI